MQLLRWLTIHVEAPSVDYEKLSSDRIWEPSAKIWERVVHARERQRTRFGGTSLQYNGDMRRGEVRKFRVIDDAGRNFPRAAMRQM